MRSKPKANVTDYFAFSLPQIDKGPYKTAQSNVTVGMYSNGISTAVTTASGVKATIKSAITTPIGSSSGFINIGELTSTADGISFKITEISPDTAQGPNVQWVQWHSCILKKAVN